MVVLTKNQRMIAFAAVAVAVVVGAIIAGIVLSQSKDPVKPATKPSGATTKPSGATTKPSGATTKPSGAVPTEVAKEICADFKTECSEWVSQGECEKHPDYMRSRCKKSCKFC